MKYTLIALFTLLLTACAPSANASSSTTPVYGEEPAFSGEPATPPATLSGRTPVAGFGDDQSINSDDPTPPAGALATTQVTGKVTDGSGNPIHEAGVSVTKSSTSVPEILVLTNEEGQYVWVLPPGEFTLTVHKDGYVEVSKDIIVKEGADVKLDFQLEPKP